MKNKKDENKVSIRLNKEAMTIVNEAVNNSHNKSAFINKCITSTEISDMYDKSRVRRMLPHLCMLSDYAEHIDSMELRDSLKKEIHEIWLALK